MNNSIVRRRWRRPSFRMLVGPVIAFAHWPAIGYGQHAAGSLAFHGVTVVDVRTGELHPAQTVVIAGNRIQAIGGDGAVKVPKDARVVDARGQYLIPGLWDMHTHVMAFPDVVYPLLLANGITGIRDMGTGVPLDTLRQWRREVLAGTRIGPPRQLFAGPLLEDVRGKDTTRPRCVPYECFHGNPAQRLVDGPADVRQVVDSLQAAGADFIKVHGMSMSTYWALVAEAHRVGIPFAGHLPDNHANTPDSTIVLVASDSGQRTIEHTGGLKGQCLGARASVERCRVIAERHRRNGTWNVLGPTIFITKPIRVTAREFWHRFRFWPDSVTRDWSMPPDSILDRPGKLKRSLHLEVAEQAGLPMMVGTDLGAPVEYGMPGFALHDDLAFYVASGLNPLTALQAVTLNPAKFLGATDSLGTVEAGKLADLVLLDADPLTDIWNTTTIRAVVANGRYFDRAALDQLFAQVQAAASTAAPAPVPARP